MTRIAKIGDIILDNPLFIKEEFDINRVNGKAFKTLGGGLIVYETVKRNNANYVTLISKKSGWISEDTVEKIRTLLDDIDVLTTITDTNDIITNIRPAFEKGNIIKVSDIINDNGGWFSVEINLCKV